MDISLDTGNGSRVARGVEQSRWFEYALRAGLVCWGVMYLLLAWLAVQLAFGDRSRAVNKNGAFRQLAEQPLGRVLLWVVAGGFVVLMVWQALEALFGHGGKDGAKRALARTISVVRMAIYGVLAWTSLQVATGSGSSGKNTQGWTAKLMSQPFGRWLVAALGVAVLGYGIANIYKGVTDKFEKHLDLEGRTGGTGTFLRGLGKAGYVSRGLAFGAVGGLVVWAAISHDANKSGGLDQALSKLLDAPLGPALVTSIGVGFACFGLFCFAWAKYFRE